LNANDSVKNNQIKTYYPQFDWLRGWLAITIVMSHLGLVTHAIGGVAVYTFLTLSGFVVGSSLLRLDPKKLHQFFLNRALRVWVPYYLSILMLIVASILHKDILSAKWYEFVIYKITFVYNLFGEMQIAQVIKHSPLHGTGDYVWSINLQEQFYLLAPLLLVLAPTKYGKSTVLWFSLATVAWIGQFYPSLFFGVLLAVALHNQHILPGRVIQVGLFVVSTYAFFCTSIPSYLIVPFLNVSIVMLLTNNGAKNPKAELFGGMSLQLYLNAWVGTFLVNGLLKYIEIEPNLFTKLFTVVVSIIIAMGLYLLIDSRLILNRQKISSLINAKLVTFVSYLLVSIGLIYGFTLH
jgi:peptidoglycan/LPS O-acetylase OafA/YrhL